MATASLSSFFELKLVNDNNTHFTVPAIGRGYNIVEIEITTSGGPINNILAGKNDVSGNVFLNWIAGVAGIETTSFVLDGGDPVFDRAQIGPYDTVVVNPISALTNQLLLTCISPSATPLTIS